LRVILGLVSLLLLAAMAQPVSAQCVNRAGAVTCMQNGKHSKYPNATQQLPKETPAETPDTNGPAVVLQPAATDERNAWVLKPQEAGDANPAVVACGSGTGC